MLDCYQTAQERWGGVHQLIDRWLQARSELIAAYNRLSGKPQSPLIGDEVQRFCQTLLDYVSSGHFEIYEQLVAEARAFDDRPALALAEQIYPRLQVITEAVLAFNDRCDNGDCRDAGQLDEDLRGLGQRLHERFELEDCLIEVLHNAHSQTPASIS